MSDEERTKLVKAIGDEVSKRLNMFGIGIVVICAALKWAGLL